MVSHAHANQSRTATVLRQCRCVILDDLIPSTGGKLMVYLIRTNYVTLSNRQAAKHSSTSLRCGPWVSGVLNLWLAFWIGRRIKSTHQLKHGKRYLPLLSEMPEARIPDTKQMHVSCSRRKLSLPYHGAVAIQYVPYR